MQNGKLLFLIFIYAFYFLICSTETYSQTLEIFKEGVTTIAEVKFKGLDQYEDKEKKKIEIPLYESDFRSHLDYEKVLIFNKEKYNSKEVEQALKSIKEQLYAIGYLDANITAFGEKIIDNQARLIFSIKRGNLIPVSEIHIVGNKNIATDEIVKTMKDCLEDSWKFFYKPRYEYCTRKNVSDLIFSKGYVTGLVALESQRVSENIVVTVKVTEGIRYRIGEIKIDGLRIFSEPQFLEILGQKQGDVVNSSKLREVLYERLKGYYGDQGYIQYDAYFEPDIIAPKIDGQDGTVNFKFIIDEGRRFKLRRILIVGVELSQAQKIIELLGLIEGKFFSQRTFEEGIKRINDTKEFRFIDKDKDVKMITDEESDDIDLVIKINKK